MSSIDLIKAFEKVGLKPVSVGPFKFDPQVHKDVEDFLKAKRESEERAAKIHMVFR